MLRALAERILENLDHIERAAPRPDAQTWRDPPYSDTQLIMSLLGVLVFPSDRASTAMGALLQDYEGLQDVITVHHAERTENGSVALTTPDGCTELVDPKQVKNLPRLLRNSIAHFNMLPLAEDDRFVGVRIWNRDDDRGVITLIADIKFAPLRPLARHILKELANPTRWDLDLNDPEDPLKTLRKQQPGSQKRKSQKLNTDIWEKLVAACGGDEERARTEMDRALIAKAAELSGARPPQPRNRGDRR